MRFCERRERGSPLPGARDSASVGLVTPAPGPPQDEAAQSAARALTRTALERGSADNVSALVMRFHWS